MGNPLIAGFVEIQHELAGFVEIHTTTVRLERFFTKLEQIHARNFLKEAVEHALLANLRPFVKHLPNTCQFKNP
jgi:predicted DNA-binding ribbon-helix-helix protein